MSDRGQEDENKGLETPNADAVEAFLEHQRKIQYGEKLDPEEAKRQAQELARMEDGLVKLLETYPKEHPHGGEIIPGVFLETNEYQLRLSSHIENLEGMGGKFIVFSKGFKKYPNDFPDHVGVDSLNRLDVGIHTDPQTRADIEMLEDRKAINLIQSIYFFDPDGNYGKVVSMPRSIPDTREDIGNPAVIQKYANAEMTMGDFELAKAALEMLDRRLRS